MKMVKFFPLALLFLATLLLTTSCNKDVEMQNLADQPLPALSGTIDFDDIGERHNALLDALAADEDFSAAKVTGNSTDFAAYFASIIKTTTECVDCNESEVSTHIASSLVTIASFSSIADMGDTYLETEKINAADKAQFDQLNALVVASEEQATSTVEQNLTAFESSVNDDVNMSSDGRRAMLIGASVMRHSNSYWRTVQATPSSPWHDIEKDRDESPSLLIWFWRDLGGAIAVALSDGTWDDGIRTGVRRVIRGAAAASGFI